MKEASVENCVLEVLSAVIRRKYQMKAVTRDRRSEMDLYRGRMMSKQTLITRDRCSDMVF